MSSDGYHPNYGYVGAPANYNGTGPNGGDSGMFSSPLSESSSTNL